MKFVTRVKLFFFCTNLFIYKFVKKNAISACMFAILTRSIFLISKKFLKDITEKNHWVNIHRP